MTTVLDIEWPEGQATFDMENLRPERTGLPFVVWISQKDQIRHDVRVKIALGPKVIAGQMASYFLRPFAHRDGPRLSSQDEGRLREWLEKNERALVDYWTGDIEYTEDVLEQLVRV